MDSLAIVRISVAILLVVKAYLHTYIADKSDDSIIGGSGHFSLYVFWFYTKPVPEKYQDLKRLCNKIQLVNMIVLLFLVIIGLLD
jgi:hypothetical protein